MSSTDEIRRVTSQRPQRSRTSIAHIPSSSSVFAGAEQENSTVDLDTSSSANFVDVMAEKAAKKTRSKSIGPGGLDALREGAGNRRKSTLPSIVKSILKPTISLSPFKEIPALSTTRKGRHAKSDARMSTAGATSLLSATDNAIDLSVSKEEGVTSTLNEDFLQSLSAEDVTRLSDTRTIALKTEAQQAEAKRALGEKQAIERRDARRKSLANRRVSFAPEATLHTWDVVEYAHDSTTSSSSTASSQRTSSHSAPSLPMTPALPFQSAARPDDLTEVTEPPSTPPMQVEEVQVFASPTHQRDLHQKKRRRTSGIPPMNFNNPADEIFSSPYSGSSAAGSDDTSHTVITDGGNSDSDEDASGVEGESTMMEMDVDDITSHSVGSGVSISSNAPSNRLDAALRQAAAQAATHGINFDEHGDQDLESADDKITSAVRTWTTATTPRPAAPVRELSRNPFSPAFKASIGSDPAGAADDESEEMSMDMTRAVGAIVRDDSGVEDVSMDMTRAHGEIIIPTPDVEELSMDMTKAIGAILPQIARPTEECSTLDDEAMDLTMAAGAIDFDGQSAVEEDEEMSMELTMAAGRVVLKEEQSSHMIARRPSSTPQSENESSLAEETAMDVTMALGGIIIAPSSETPRTWEEQTSDAINKIFSGDSARQHSNGSNQMETNTVMELVADALQSRSPSISGLVNSPERNAILEQDITSSPTAMKTAAASRKLASLVTLSTTRSTSNQVLTPARKPVTPSKQITPASRRPTAPGKTPPSRNITFRSASPKKLFKEELRRTTVTPKPVSAKRLFTQQIVGKIATPSIVLQPRSRGTSGLGVDKTGIGSPRVAALLDRRRSIGDDAKIFTPTQPGKERPRILRFQEDQVLQSEYAAREVEDDFRKKAWSITEMKADLPERQEEKDVTVNLREMIRSLTPKKKARPRKSLHIGAARGLLGKRPIELDEGENSSDDSPKRLKSREGSPVKSVILPPPPSKMETTGGRGPRAKRADGKIAAGQITTLSIALTPVQGAVTTPKGQGRFENVEGPASVNKSADLIQSATAESSDSPSQHDESFEKIHLQAFLNLTSIRFMELTTTKRRQTVLPQPTHDEHAGSNGEDAASALESCVVAGTCTIPMLELYQHSCRELKKYISEGRTIVREIEADTFEENPPLFREYMAASPDVKFIMDNQFRNVKTHARLLSKEMWYEWRMKLLDGLKEGLFKIQEGLKFDEGTIVDHEKLLSILPPIVELHERLVKEHTGLQHRADELASCDQDELRDTRTQLLKIHKNTVEKRMRVVLLQQQAKEKEERIKELTAQKACGLEEIKEAEKIREECRGWSIGEVMALKARVAKVEAIHGWTIIACSTTDMTLTYRHAISLTLRPSSFAPNNPTASSSSSDQVNGPIFLSYIADEALDRPIHDSSANKFFVEGINANLQSLEQSTIRPINLLNSIATSWTKVQIVQEEIRQLHQLCFAETVVRGEKCLEVKSALLLTRKETKLKVIFEINIHANADGLDMSLDVTTAVVYGERFIESKIREFLRTRIGNEIQCASTEKGTWARALSSLKDKLEAQERKE